MNIELISAHSIGIIGTVLATIAYVPQIRHLVAMRCGEGISLTAYMLWCSASTLLCVYAVIAKEPVFIALQGFHAIACAVILLFGTRYRTSRCPLHQESQVSLAL